LVFLILLIVPYKSSKGPSRNAWYKIGRLGVEGIRLFQYRNLDKSNLNKSEIIYPSSQMGKLKNIMPMEKAPVAFPKHICSSY
jgi:hypothetical protein